MCEFTPISNGLSPTGFVKATGRTGLKKILSNDQIAISLMNGILRDMDAEVTIRQIIAKEDPKVHFCEINANAIINYQAIANNGAEIILKLQDARIWVCPKKLWMHWVN
ncbi:MAG: hypothetical protein LBI77_02330 [Puniceicoccales bacterium]|nr:hypothetical protein [Puniceicoccales bacterium]